MKKRYQILISVVLTSVALFLISLWSVHTIIDNTYAKPFDRAISFIFYFTLLLLVEIIGMTLVIFLLLRKHKREGNQEKFTGYLYSSYYMVLLMLAFILFGLVS